MMKRVAVVLSGCGVFDGAEIHESVLTLLALARRGAEAVCVAPDIDQAQVVDHVTGTPVEGERRNVLRESARIARGSIRALSNLSVSEVDAVVFPGGFGAAKNLCTFADDGPECRVEPSVERLLLDAYEASKPIGAVCIAPALVARVLGRKADGLEVTIGVDEATAAAIEKMGAVHVPCDVRSAHVDRRNKVVTTPAYMLARGVEEVEEGVDRLVDELLRLCG